MKIPQKVKIAGYDFKIKYPYNSKITFYLQRLIITVPSF